MKIRLYSLFIFLMLIAGPTGAQVLNVKKITQENSQWCWAAVSACVLNYYGQDIKQCDIAEFTRTHEQFTDINFGGSPCCQSPFTCNNWNYMDGGAGSLQDIVMHFDELPTTMIMTAITKEQVAASLAANKLFVFRWQRSSGGHFLVGHGLEGDQLYYMDPWPGEGKKIATYTSVVSNSVHTWTHTMMINKAAAVPAPAGAISGPASPCQGQEVTYSVVPISHALTYEWTLPEGIHGSSKKESITVMADSIVSGTISVKGVNPVGTGDSSILAVTVSPLPLQAGPIVGPVSVCQRQQRITYSIEPVDHAESYVWALPSMASGSSTSNSITVDFGFQPGQGTITVKGVNTCSEGVEASLPIEVFAFPERPVITQTGNTLRSSAPEGNQWYDESGPIDGATSQEYTITRSGTFFVITTLHGCPSDPSDEITAILNSAESEALSGSVVLYPNPAGDYFTVDLPGQTNGARVWVRNLLGITLLDQEIHSRTRIDSSSWPEGMYFVGLESGSWKQTVRLVKK